MSGDQVTITQIDDKLDYVRLWDASASAYVNLDAESKIIGGTPANLIHEVDDKLFIGNSSPFAYIGFLPDTGGDYGSVLLQYWNETGGAWVDMTPVIWHDSTQGFSQRGYIAFTIGGSWSAGDPTETGDLPSAYWIRISVSSVTIMATMNHMMRSLVINQVMQLGSSVGEVDMRYTRDINKKLCKRDVTYHGARSGHIDMTPVSLETGAMLNLLLDWEYYRNELYIQDSRASATISFSNDSYYLNYTGRLVKVPDGLKSMEKMVDTGYNLQFLFDDCATLSTSLGLDG